MSVKVVINERSLNRMMTRQDGPVGRYLYRKATGVERRAVNNLVPHRRSGAAQAALHFVGLFRDELGMYAKIGTDATPADQGRTTGDTRFQYPVALETGKDPVTGRNRGWGRRHAFLEPALYEEFGKPFPGV